MEKIEVIKFIGFISFYLLSSTRNSVSASVQGAGIFYLIIIMMNQMGNEREFVEKKMMNRMGNEREFVEKK